jgi:predicted DNA-binding transcriptional regulator YafY
MGAWHLIGYCHLRKSMRDLKLSRIREPRMLEETFSIPRNFSAKNYFHSSFGIYKGKDKHQVVLRFTPETAKWISDQIWHRDQQAKTLKDGSLELSFPVANFSEIAREILKYGSGVEVIKPEGLRQFIKAEIDKAAKIY